MAALTVAALLCVAWRLVRVERRLDAMRPLNPHARLLGRVVEARKYEASDWERFVVVAVSWHGSVCLRRADRPGERGFWMRHRNVTGDRFREVDA